MFVDDTITIPWEPIDHAIRRDTGFFYAMTMASAGDKTALDDYMRRYSEAVQKFLNALPPGFSVSVSSC